jgi:hypothetical protein
MNKQFSTLETLKILLEHKDVLFRLIKIMDRSGERFISEAQLAIEVLEYIAPLDALEQQRLQIAFATENLLQTHVLADKDIQEGVTRLIFQDAVIGLFRLCHTSLYQELTDAKLKSKLAGLWRVQKRFESGSLSFYEGDPDYTELVDDAFEQLSMLLDLLKRNVVRMQSLSRDFEHMSANVSKDPQAYAEFRQGLLTQVSTLFERHIKPTQSFLNPNIKLREGDNLFDTVTSIKRVLESNGKINKADQVFRFSLSFSSIFKPITIVAHQVDQFLQKTRASMAQFNALEHHYQRLLEVYTTTLDHKLNKTKIDGAYAREYSYVAGLKRLPKPKDLRISDSASYFENLFSELDLRMAERSHHLFPVDGSEAWISHENSSKLERALALYDYLDNMPLRPTQDLTAMLHYRLKDQFEDYQFVDLLGAVIRMRVTPNHLQLKTTNKKAHITHGDNVYVYRRKQLFEKDPQQAPELEDITHG